MLNIENTTTLPSHKIVKKETEHILLSFCTFCTLLKCKKMSFQNVFLLLLQDDKLRDIFKELVGADSNYEIVKIFIDYDPQILKSKYVTKFLNTHKKINLSNR